MNKQVSIFWGLILISFTIFSGSNLYSQSQPLPAGRVVTYFIAADEVDWDYTPRGRNLAGIPHHAEEEDEAAETTASAHRVYHKVIFREYTDASFQKLKPRSPDWEHLGILGPLIRAEVGDTIQVFFKNNTNLITSMHPHGLAYAKDSEGAYYSDGTKGDDKKDDMVQPKQSYRYLWTVPERSGPAHGDGSSILWMYHGHFMEHKDVNTGMLGPIIITRRGEAGPDGRPKDVDREFVTAFAVFDESASWFFSKEIAKNGGTLPLHVSNPAIREMNTLDTINGLIEANVPGLTMKKGERVRWYLFANSNDDDMHTVHWHGSTGLYMHMRTDTVSLTPMGMAIADIVPDTPGTWLLHCHVNDHMMDGMQALFTVLP